MIAACVAVLLIVTYIPITSTFLPKALAKEGSYTGDQSSASSDTASKDAGDGNNSFDTIADYSDLDWPEMTWNQVLQPAIYGFRCTAGTQNQGFLVLWLQKWFYGLCKSYDVGVVANQFHFAFGKADNLNDIDGAYLGCVFVQFVQVGDDLLLVRDSHIQSTEVGIFLDNFHEILDTWNFELSYSASIFSALNFSLKYPIEKECFNG